ncbi:ATP12 family chaperone protein [Aliiruegeria lutimaris]|uniref:Chaperone required for the assembly of the F1-ATPase n=1 Tax=Aliiruegeria lutimaris TaxID=571298 RepID=A0A1G9H8N1_9RHOB|nr:ATP12 family protein [Aliiruegeria lutimaris]SDL09290.1 Chaperone required for the assembly of the F1-ATPase [Aliiruegeria lutimaris]
MSEWKLKRFWKSATAELVEGGWQILLDGRPVKTPAKAPLRVPSLALAEAIAAEWDAQQEAIDPATMPLTRSANAAIDKVSTQFDEVATLIAAYGETDLCCYRAEGPEALCQGQAEAWDELLQFARDELNAPLEFCAGVVPLAQPGPSIEALKAEVAALDAFALTALHDLVSISGSLLIGLAAIRERFPAEDLWQRSRVDERFQESQWGYDEEAAVTEAFKREEFLHAQRFFCLSRPSA